MDIYVVDDSFLIEKKVGNIVRLINEKSKSQLFDFIKIDYPQKFFEELPVKKIKDNDIFILDINLNTFFNGIDLGEAIRSKNASCYIVYLTSFENSAMPIINRKINAWSYIIKEIDEGKFRNSIEKTLKEIIQDSHLKEESEDFTTFMIQKKQIVVPTRDIIYLKSMTGYKNSVLVKTIEEDLIVDGSLKTFKKKYQKPYFFKDFRAYIINLYAISEWSRRGQYIGFINGDILELGTKSIDKLNKVYKQITI
ncbi:LytR/AlgR family response regulator transcription factor [Enterococcus faecium]